MTYAACAASGNTVMELTGRRIESVEKKLYPSPLVRWVSGAFASVFEQIAVRYFEAMAVVNTDNAIWFRGVAAEAWGENIDVRERMGAMPARVERIKTSLMDVREKMLALEQRSDTSPAIKTAAANVAFSVVDLFDALESFKWTLLELEANHSPISEGYSASSPQELEKLFDQMALEE